MERFELYLQVKVTANALAAITMRVFGNDARVVENFDYSQILPEERDATICIVSEMAGEFPEKVEVILPQGTQASPLRLARELARSIEAKVLIDADTDDELIWLCVAPTGEVSRVRALYAQLDTDGAIVLDQGFPATFRANESGEA